ncbi:hypothetical protein H5410_040391 [Solanum commersonii]|uniref:Uncharacterized protein n=1 Tax=Solanum commersonii TaxID=4109 RepID=A0A9J5XPZ0_SOLCO|nr:hypothetical protein H5410_040391 [Solanum commersonii]
MSDPSSPPKSPLSQEIEKPSSFSFSIPSPEDSPSTPPTLLEEDCKLSKRVPHGVQLVFYQTPETMGVDSEEEDKEETLLVLSRKGVQRENASNMCVSDLGEPEAAPEIRIEEEPIESEKKRKRKEKKRRVPQEIGSSDTESEDISRAVTKWRKEAEEQQIKAKVNIKSGKKSSAKRAKGHDNNGCLKIKAYKGTWSGPVPCLPESKVCEFYYKLELLDDGSIQTTVREVKISLNEESLGIILGVPFIGIKSIEGCKPSVNFSQKATKHGDIKCVGLPKTFLN